MNARALLAAAALLPACFPNAYDYSPRRAPQRPVLDAAVAVDEGPSIHLPHPTQELRGAVSIAVEARVKSDAPPNSAYRFAFTHDGRALAAVPTTDAPGESSEHRWIQGVVDAQSLGDYTVELFAGERSIGTQGFRVANVPCLGEGTVERVLDGPLSYLQLDAGFDLERIERAPKATQAYVVIGQWELTDTPRAFVVEWIKDGHVAHTDKGISPEFGNLVDELERPYTADVRVFGRHCLVSGSQSYEVPLDVMHVAGTWQVRILRTGHPPTSVTFGVDTSGIPTGTPLRIAHYEQGDTVRRYPLAPETLPESAELGARLASVPAWKHPVDVMVERRNPLPITTEELRALTRSKELFEARALFNDDIAPSGGARVTPYFNNVQDYTWSPEQKFREAQRQQAATTAARVAADAQARREAIQLDLPKLKALIQKHGQAFGDGELPARR